ncbi:MAG: hypothetical protein KF849_05295 [Rhizobiaceae bacterium]|nr:hypothetical protein [Rhizobiaceae bacterium]
MRRWRWRRRPSVVFKDDLGFTPDPGSVSWTAVSATSAGGVTTWTATNDHYPSGSPAAVLVINGRHLFLPLYAPVVHGTAGTAEEGPGLDFFYTATDGDGDSTSARLRIGSMTTRRCQRR